MIRLLTDHDVNGHIIAGVLKQKPEFDLVRLVDLGLAAVADPGVLAWAAEHGRIVLSNDRRTMRAAADGRLSAGEAMPGLFLIRPRATIAGVIDSLLPVDECAEQAVWRGLIEWLPFTR